MITLYTMHRCGYCEKAKHYLSELGIARKVIQIETASDEELQLVKHDHTFPQIWIQNSSGEHEFIGGYDQLVEAFPI